MADQNDGFGVDEVREQDRFLPIANISRIMKRSLPENAKIAKDAKETVQECVSEFISFITSEASDKCQQEKRKTINGDDLLWAMSTLGFDKYVDPLKLYLAKYRESVKGEKPERRGTGPPGGRREAMDVPGLGVPQMGMPPMGGMGFPQTLMPTGAPPPPGAPHAPGGPSAEAQPLPPGPRFGGDASSSDNIV
mmetsp:Transcript_15323/g.21157  ORF Transcript_15323/g.21157 Transcript_15323/m.21157 type:complete len:193 (+) Transcript_15323:162-740(+)|eukprot:CAMPEP_0194569656 /NCGR_PEP_ID=MMETSP0292-20121207/7279_1 /TAXON_ID=39354 /ORGANISM="Heterosigma akashiwo, Strain CCMP2393" /LENGTH=192 /DNA_ID=CAMNT_0039419939 /DNA_START=147 /DNA_END=725 /DNA_ORIENTATION=+